MHRELRTSAPFSAVWALADWDATGRLSEPQFVLFMFLLKQLKKGRQLPPRLGLNQVQPHPSLENEAGVCCHKYFTETAVHIVLMWTSLAGKAPGTSAVISLTEIRRTCLDSSSVSADLESMSCRCHNCLASHVTSCCRHLPPTGGRHSWRLCPSQYPASCKRSHTQQPLGRAPLWCQQPRRENRRRSADRPAMLGCRRRSCDSRRTSYCSLWPGRKQRERRERRRASASSGRCRWRLDLTPETLTSFFFTHFSLGCRVLGFIDYGLKFIDGAFIVFMQWWI